MRVLIADKLNEAGRNALAASGNKIRFDPDLKDETLVEAITEFGPHVLVVRSTKVLTDALLAHENLRLIVRAGAGYNTIDVDTASRHSIMVANCPGKNAVAVAELTFALILALDRRVVDNTADLRAGAWNKKEYGKARGLKGRTLGIVGMGKIGQAVVQRAQGMEMNVAAWSRSLSPEQADAQGVDYCGSIAEVAEKCHVLSLHLASTPETKNIINAEILAELAPGSYLINTSRAEVLDYDALADAVRDRGLRVGLDVYPQEPGAGAGSFAPAILQAGGVIYGTHHIGASTEQAQEAIAAEAVRIINEYRRTGHVENCVNLCHASPASGLVVIRHLNRPGVLAHTLQIIRENGINVEEMHNQILLGRESGCAQIKVGEVLSEETLEKIKAGDPNILGVSQIRVK